jgi:hypothetical protein
LKKPPISAAFSKRMKEKFLKNELDIRDYIAVHISNCRAEQNQDNNHDESD